MRGFRSAQTPLSRGLKENRVDVLGATQDSILHTTARGPNRAHLAKVDRATSTMATEPPHAPFISSADPLVAVGTRSSRVYGTVAAPMITFSFIPVRVLA